MTEINRKSVYTSLEPQVKALLYGEPDLIANAANLISVIHNTLGFFWTGFYFVKGNELVLGPFQGPTACTRIGFGKGVCGSSWKEKRTLIVPRVHEFPGHIACNGEAESEIVVPLLSINNEVMGVLDIDSDKPDDFTEVDKEFLERFCTMLQPSLA